MKTAESATRACRRIPTAQAYKRARRASMVAGGARLARAERAVRYLRTFRQVLDRHRETVRRHQAAAPLEGGSRDKVPSRRVCGRGVRHACGCDASRLAAADSVGGGFTVGGQRVGA